MKLLKKNEIDILKSRERQSEIDRGVALARRVDTLRELAANEEASLEAFRRSSVTALHAEIKELTVKRDVLAKEISDLMDERAEGMKVVEARIEELNQQRKDMDKLVTELNEKLDTVFYQENILNDSIKSAKENEQRSATFKVRAEAELNDIYHRKLEIEIQQRDIENIKQQTMEWRVNTEAELAIRERNVQQQETANSTEKARLEKLAVELGDKERAINDKYNALLQAQKHLQ